MVETVVDSALLSCPMPESSSADFESWINLLITWREIRAANWPRLYFSRTAYAALQAANSYPSWELLKKRLPECAPHLSAKDVFDILDGLFTKVPTLEDRIGLLDCDFYNFSSVPDVGSLNCNEELKEGLRSLCIASAIWFGLERLPDLQPWILSELIGSQTDSLALSAECIYEMMEDAGTIVSKDVKNVSLKCISSIDIWKSQLPAHELLAAAGNSDDVVRAIHLSVIQMALAEGISVPLFQASWWTGREFLTTIQNLHLQNNDGRIRGVLRACAETILRRNMAATHKLRENAGANSNQRTSGIYKAWRRDIDYEYHLHYWQRDDNHVELASVVSHNDMSIPNPT